MKNNYRYIFLPIVFICVFLTGPASAQNKKYRFEKEPVWADEFSYNGKPDSKKWGYDLGGDGWGNHELEFYTDKNASVADGKLIITAKKEKNGNQDYTSTRLVSKNKGDFLYGRFEARIRLPEGRGTWPAFWMLPTDWAYGDWPASGEIDIMEHVGYDPDVVHVSVHTKAYNHTIHTEKTAVKTVAGARKGFHTYRIDWSPENITGYIDGKAMFTFANEHKGFAAWPFDKRFHILLNLAVGGDWGGQKGVDEKAFPAKMEVDWVRVYKLVQ